MYQAGPSFYRKMMEALWFLLLLLQLLVPQPGSANPEAQLFGEPVEARQLHHLERPDPVTAFPTIETWAGGYGPGTGQHHLHMPYSAFYVESNGQLYVSDTHNHRVQRWNVPASGQAPVTVAGGSGQGRGLHQLRFPKGIVVDSSGNLFVADSGNHRVVKWAPGASEGVVVAGEYGALLDKQGAQQGSEALCCRAGRATKQLQDPHGIFVDGQGTLYVADTGNDRVQRWVGQVVTTVAGGASSQALSRPEAVFAKNDVVYVSDTGHDRVMAFAPAATDWSVVAGGLGRGAGKKQLVSPAGIWVDDSLQEDGVAVTELLVVDTHNHRIVKHRMAGDYLTAEPTIVAGACLQNPPYIAPCIGGGIHYPPNPAPDRVDLINPANTNPPVYHFWGPMGLFVGQGGRNITVVDTLNHRVLTWVGYR